MGETKLSLALDAFLSVYGDFPELKQDTFRAILAEKLEEALEEAQTSVYFQQLAEFKRTEHYVKSQLDYLVDEVATRTANQAVELLLNQNAPFAVHLESTRFLSATDR